MNLLNMFQSQFSEQNISQIGGMIGENETNTKSALSIASTALLGSLVGKATSSPDGAGEVFNMVKQQQAGGASFDSVGGLLSGVTSRGGLGQITGGAGSSLLNSVLGSKLGGVSDFISKGSGIKNSSATSLLSVAAPLLMGALRKQVSSQGLDAKGFGQLLGSQTDYLKDAMPSSLADTVGIGHLMRGAAPPVSEAPPPVSEPAWEMTREVSERTAQGAREEHRYAPARETKRDGAGFLKWAWIPLLLLLAIPIVTRMREGREVREPAGAPATTEGRLKTVTLPNGQELQLTGGGAADKLATAIRSGNLNQSITLEDIKFDNSGRISTQSQRSIQEVASVLKATPDLNATIIGRGPTQEAAEQRANAIKSALTSAGIPENRITTRAQEGSGAPILRVSG